MMRLLLGLLFAISAALGALAQERIDFYDVNIEVAQSGDLLITETLDVTVLGQQIRRGIFRELPAKYTFNGVELDYNYELISIKRNGAKEPYTVSREGNAVNWRIGNANKLLEHGPHKYEITYRVPDQIRRHRGDVDSRGARDEIYWNVIGGYWNFPITKARASINFPSGSLIIDSEAYRKQGGYTDKGYTAQIRGNSTVFETTRGFNAREGLTVSVSAAPGIIAPMSEARSRQLSWIARGGPILLGGGGLALFIYYLTMWTRVGRDPQKGPVFARYEPPKNKKGVPYSAAALHHIHHKRLKRTDALTATLMSLSMKDVIDIEAEKKTTTLTSMLANRDAADLLNDERYLLDRLFGDKDDVVTFKKKTNAALFRRITQFNKYISKQYGTAFYRSNAGWGLLGIAASLALVIFISTQPVSKDSIVFKAMLVGLFFMNFIFFIFLKAPTKIGAKVSAEIEGFKLYLETAEADRINTANPLGESPPAMTTELYERFLPYAVALGVEKPWTKQFETSMPQAARDYQPSYASGPLMRSRGGSPIKMSEALAGALTAGVAAAAPRSQSSGSGFSSGSGGGGSSGGGGGGGGGGGW